MPASASIVGCFHASVFHRDLYMWERTENGRCLLQPLPKVALVHISLAKARSRCHSFRTPRVISSQRIWNRKKAKNVSTVYHDWSWEQKWVKCGFSLQGFKAQWGREVLKLSVEKWCTLHNRLSEFQPEDREYLDGSELTSQYSMTAVEFSYGGEMRGELVCVTLVKVWCGLSMHM